ncbi:MAG: recombinase family protein [Anaerolineae bacterium]|nr:recombinase family protein [Anaerolineae bacterium]
MTSSQPLRAVIWAAVSSKAQADEDKDSLPTQEADARAVCERNGWQIVAVLKVPGHSRWYTSLEKCAADMREQGIDAFDRLMELWQCKGFDVLICRDGNRFGRTQSLHARVVEETMMIGARIYSLYEGGFVSSRNWTAFNGYKAAAEIDELRNRYKMGILRRLQRGLPSGKPPFSHRIMRDPKTAKDIRLVVDETKRPLFTAIAELIMDGVGWKTMGIELERRYGIINPNKGYRYPFYFGHDEVINPYWWGHSAQHFVDKSGAWVFDPHIEPPEGVTVWYNTHEPVWQDWITPAIHTEDVKAELRRRFELLRGKRRNPRHSILFSGLLRCDQCGVSLNAHGRAKVFRCPTKWQFSPARGMCSQTKSINQRDIRAFIAPILQVIIEHGAFADEAVDPVVDDAQLDQDIEKQETMMRNLIRSRAEDAELAYLYDAELEKVRRQLKELRRTKKDSTTAAEREQLTRDRARFAEKYRAGLNEFWAQSPAQINRELLYIFGRTRLCVRDGIIVGMY